MQGKDLTEAAANREQIQHIKSLYLRGVVTKEVAEALAKPVLERINKRQAAIARKWHKKHCPMTFIGLMR